MKYIRDFFAGGNTPQGFFSYYDYILPTEYAKKIICIKGGPGTGKSGLMKRAVQKYEARYSVEQMHCSSDPNSLDGVVVPELGLAIIDGTAPHVVDPKYPGGVDRIFNAGDFWCEEAIAAHREDIISLNQTIARGYRDVYYYLKVAGDAWHHLHSLKQSVSNDSAVEWAFHRINEHILHLTDEVKACKASTRKLFLKAITPSGVVDYADDMSKSVTNVYRIRALYHSEGAALLARIDEAVRMRGFKTQQFYTPFSPQNGIEYLYIEETDTLFSLVEDENHTLDVFLDLDAWPKGQKPLSSILDSMAYDKNVIQKMSEKAITQLQQNKKWHDALEMCYIPYMDFERLTSSFQKILP